jgi:hypothetical protein
MGRTRALCGQGLPHLSTVERHLRSVQPFAGPLVKADEGVGLISAQPNPNRCKFDEGKVVCG